MTSRLVTRFLIGYLHNRGISDWLLTQQRYFWLATYTTEVFWLAATWPAGLLQGFWLATYTTEVFLIGYLHNRGISDWLLTQQRYFWLATYTTEVFLIGYLHNRGILTGCHLTSRLVTRFLIGYLHNRGISDWLLTQQRYFWLATYTTEVFLIGYLHNRGISDWLLTQQRYFDWLPPDQQACCCQTTA